jgi:WD40 repeat protein
MGFVILATAGYDHVIRFWDAQSGKCYRALQHKESVRAPLQPAPSILVTYFEFLPFHFSK